MNRGVSSIQVWPVVWIQMIFLVIERRLRISKLLSIRLVSFFITVAEDDFSFANPVEPGAVWKFHVRYGKFVC